MKHLLVIEAWMWCPKCLTRQNFKKIGIRDWQCDECGTTISDVALRKEEGRGLKLG